VSYPILTRSPSSIKTIDLEKEWIKFYLWHFYHWSYLALQRDRWITSAQLKTI
jgi:hypothetical protein